MGYEIRVLGELKISARTEDIDLLKAQQVVIDYAKENGLPIPSFESREGLSAEAIAKIKKIDSDSFFKVTSRGIKDTSNALTAYSFEEDFEAIIEVIKTDGVAANGIIYVIGEEQGDVQRYIVKDNVVTNEQAELRWPDGTSAEEVAAR